VSGVEPKLQVESALPKFYRLNHCPRKPVIHLGRSSHGRRKTELLTVILTCESNALIFGETP
jgi:hypothetical protein